MARRPLPASTAPGFDPPTLAPNPGPATPPLPGATAGEFDPPPGNAPGDPAGGDPRFALSYAIDDQLRQTKDQLEKLIFARATRQAGMARASAAQAPGAHEMITGVGIGPAHRDFESVGPGGPGAPVLNVYVTEKMDVDVVKSILADTYGVHALSSDQHYINIIHTGPIDAHAHRHRERPAPCGISVGHYAITAGTLGALARGRSEERQRRLLMLSNNHVLANVNAGQIGDNILQSGAADQGVNPQDRVATLERWVPINLAGGAVNLVDCATAWCWPETVRREFIYRNGTTWSYFRVDPNPMPASVGMPVGKSGRTTQLTSGRVIDVSASITVGYGSAGPANFRDQITIKGNDTLFSQPGDSGSLIWTWDSRRSPVGLLFAGGNQFTFANKIQHVLDALDINLYT